MLRNLLVEIWSVFGGRTSFLAAPITEVNFFFWKYESKRRTTSVRADVNSKYKSNNDDSLLSFANREQSFHGQ